MMQPSTPQLPPQVRGVALLLWSVSLDHPELAVTPFVLAQSCAALEREVELVFTATSVRLLQKCEQTTPIGYGPAPQTLGQILHQTQDAGVRLLVCNQALQQLGLHHDQLIPCARGSVLQFSARVTDPAWRALVL